MSEASKHQGFLTLGNGARWAENLDFKKPVIYGFAFIALVIAVLAPWMHFEMKAQELSFQSAVKTLAGKDLKEPLTQRGAVLLKKDGIYRWSALIWERKTEVGSGSEVSAAAVAASAAVVKDTDFRLKIFSARVDRSDDYRVIELTVIPYEQKAAYAVGLYDDIVVD